MKNLNFSILFTTLSLFTIQLNAQVIMADFNLNAVCEQACNNISSGQKMSCIHECSVEFKKSNTEMNENCICDESKDKDKESANSNTDYDIAKQVLDNKTLSNKNSNLIKTISAGIEYRREEDFFTAPVTLFVESPKLEVLKFAQVNVNAGASYRNFDKKEISYPDKPHNEHYEIYKGTTNSLSIGLGVKIPIGAIAKVGHLYFNSKGELISKYINYDKKTNSISAFRVEILENGDRSIDAIYSIEEKHIKYMSFQARYTASLGIECKSKNKIIDGTSFEIGSSIYNNGQEFGEILPYMAIKKNISISKK